MRCMLFFDKWAARKSRCRQSGTLSTKFELKQSLHGNTRFLIVIFISCILTLTISWLSRQEIISVTTASLKSALLTWDIGQATVDELARLGRAVDQCWPCFSVRSCQQLCQQLCQRLHINIIKPCKLFPSHKSSCCIFRGNASVSVCFSTECRV